MILKTFEFRGERDFLEEREYILTALAASKRGAVRIQTLQRNCNKFSNINYDFNLYFRARIRD